MDKNMLKNICYKFLLIFFRIVSPIILIPYIYRQINIDEMGKINFVLSFSTIFYMISDLGIYNLGLRTVSKYKNNKEKLNQKISEIMQMKNIIVLIMLAIYYLVIIYLEYFSLDFIISSFMIFSLFFHVEWILEGIEKFYFITKKTILVRILSFVLMFLFVRGEKASFNYLVITIGYYLLNNIVSFYYLKIQGYTLQGFKIKQNQSLKKLKQLVYIAFISNINLFIFSFDKIILGIENKNEYVATYSLVEKLITMISTLVTLTFIQVYLPQLISLSLEKKEYYQMKLTELVDISCLVAFPAMVGLYSISKEILFLFGGQEYLSYLIVLKILSIYIGVYVFFEILKTNVYLALNLEKKFFFISLIVTLPLWVIKIILKEKLDIINILTFTILNFVLIILFTSIYIYKKKNIKIFNKNNILNMIISLPILFSLKFNFKNMTINIVFKVIFSIILYTISLYIFYYSKIENILIKLQKNKKT